PPPADERLWTDRRWLLYATAAATARLPGSMIPLALVLAGRSVTGSFVSGSVLAGSYAAATALSAPRRGRRLDHGALPGGLVRPLRWGAGLLLLVALGLIVRVPVPVLMVPTVLAAVTMAGVPGGIRSLLPVLWGGRTTTRAFAGDSAVTEVIWVAGPALAALLFARLGPVAPILCGAVFWMGASLLVRWLPGREARGRPKERRSVREPLRAVLPLLFLSLGIGLNIGALDVGLPALLDDRGLAPEGAGVLIAALSLSSAATTLLLTTPVAGRLVAAGSSLRGPLVCLACYGLLLVPLVTLPPYAGVLVIVLVAGCFLGPGISFLLALAPRRVPADRHGETFGLFFSTNALGVAGGTVVTGLVVEHVSVSAGLLLPVVPLVMALGVTVAVLARRRREASRS
ncbi:MFS transporter, partial [Streptomyces calidiresistens]